MDENLKKKKTLRITVFISVALVVIFSVLQLLNKKPSADNDVMTSQ